MIQSRRWKPSKASAIETSEVLTIVDSSVDRRRATHSLFKKPFFSLSKGKNPWGSSFSCTLSSKGTAEKAFFWTGNVNQPNCQHMQSPAFYVHKRSWSILLVGSGGFFINWIFILGACSGR